MSAFCMNKSMEPGEIIEYKALKQERNQPDEEQEEENERLVQEEDQEDATAAPQRPTGW